VGPSIAKAMDGAAKNGHLHMLKFLHSLAAAEQSEGKRGATTSPEWALGAAALMGHIEVAKWLSSTYPQTSVPPYTTSMAASNGNLDVLQWLHRQNDVEWSSDVMDSAAENGLCRW